MRTHEYRLPKANITPLGISLAPLAQISIYLNIPSSTVAATTVPLLHRARQSRAGEGWYGAEPTNDGQPFPQSSAKPSGRRLVWGRADERRSTFSTKPGKAEQAKVGVGVVCRRTTVNLSHKARQSRAGEGRCGGKENRRTTVRPTPSSRFQRATFPAIGKVYPTKIASQSGKGRFWIPFTFQLTQVFRIKARLRPFSPFL